MPTAVETSCGCCGRAMRGARESCVYCGWSANPAAAEQRTVRDERFSCGHTLWRFALASILLGPLTYSVVSYAVTGPATQRVPSILFAIAFAVPGPLVMLVQLFRRRNAVRTRHSGLVLPDSTEVTWNDIESVEHKRGLGCDSYSWGALSRVLPHGLVLYRAAYFLFPLLALYYVGLPAIGLLSPWHPRVIVRLQTGREIILRDLERARTFVNVVRDAADPA